MHEAIREQFATEGARFGTPWASDLWAILMRRRAAALAGDYGPLVETGALERSLTTEGAPYGGVEVRDGGKTLALSTEAPGAVEPSSARGARSRARSSPTGCSSGLQTRSATTSWRAYSSVNGGSETIFILMA